MVGLRFAEVQKFLTTPSGEVDYPTITVPIHFLHSPQHLVEWDVQESSLIDTLVGEVEKYAIPFFERFHNLDNVLLSLQSKEPKDWFMETPESRLEKLAALLRVLGKTDVATTLLEEEIAIRAQKPFPPHVAVSTRLRKLRERILNS